MTGEPEIAAGPRPFLTPDGIRATMAQIEELVGIPFAPHGRTRGGADCVGLAGLGLEILGAPWPGPPVERIAELWANGGLPELEEFPPTWEHVEAPPWRLGDVLLIDLHGGPFHVALALGAALMLHTIEGGTAKISKIRRFPILRAVRPPGVIGSASSSSPRDFVPGGGTT